jgi:hypothetical protein
MWRREGSVIIQEGDMKMRVKVTWGGSGRDMSRGERRKCDRGRVKGVGRSEWKTGVGRDASSMGRKLVVYLRGGGRVVVSGKA